MSCCVDSVGTPRDDHETGVAKLCSEVASEVHSLFVSGSRADDSDAFVKNRQLTGDSQPWRRIR